jgi:hypothetical protein
LLKIIYVNPDVRQVLQDTGILSEDTVLNWNRGEQIVKKNWADAFKCTLEGVGTVYVKRYFPQQNRLIGAFRENIAFREYRCSMRLAQLGIPQAEPILMAAVKNGFGLVKCGIYIMREVENAVSMDKLLEQMQNSPDKELLKSITDELIKQLAIMHKGSFCHWDYKPRNILVTQRQGGVVLTPIDCRSGKRMSFFTRRAYIKRDYEFLLREPLLRPYIERRVEAEGGL